MTVITARGLAPALEISNVSKRFGAVVALDKISLSVGAGEVLCLVGENGAGKSTLASIVAGLYRPDSGEVAVAGVKHSFGRPSDAFAAGVRLAPQELLLCPNLTVAENVSLGVVPCRFPGVVDRKRIAEVARERLDRLGLVAVDVNTPAAYLSLAEQAFVQIARSMSPGSRVLIADEPTAPMTASDSGRLLSLLETIRASGVAVIYISHRTDEVIALGARVVVLRDGRVTGELEPQNLSRARLVGAMVGGRDMNVGHKASLPGPTRLACRNLRTTTLKDMSFDAHAGEILGVFGIAGSGRETVGPSVFGAVPRLAGMVSIDGVEVRSSGPARAIAAGMGYVPAERRTQGLVLDMSIRENLTLASLGAIASAGILRKDRERAIAQSWIERLQLKTDSPETPVAYLSGGTQQKVVLARWLITGSKVLVLDEPTRGVDVATKAEIYRLLRDVADGGQAVVLISSDSEEIAAACDRVLVLSHGRIAAEIANPREDQLLRAALDVDSTHRTDVQ